MRGGGLYEVEVAVQRINGGGVIVGAPGGKEGCVVQTGRRVGG